MIDKRCGGARRFVCRCTTKNDFNTKERSYAVFKHYFSILFSSHCAGGVFFGAIIKAKKATYYGIGMVLARLTRAILFDENSIFTVSAYLKGEYGQRGIYIGVPAVVNRNGVREVLQMDLNEEEKAKFAASADVIHEMIEEIGMDRG